MQGLRKSTAGNRARMASDGTAWIQCGFLGRGARRTRVALPPKRDNNAPTQAERYWAKASFASGPSRRTPLRRLLSARPRSPSSAAIGSGPGVAPRVRLREARERPRDDAGGAPQRLPLWRGRSCTSGRRIAASNTPSVRPVGSTSSSGGPAWLNRKLCTAVDGRRASPSGN